MGKDVRNESRCRAMLAKVQFCLLACSPFIFANVYYTMKYPSPQYPFSACDTQWIGSGLGVSNPARDVIVSWFYGARGPLGEVYFMQPGPNGDTPMYLFHNDTMNFPSEPRSYNLGKFPMGTELYFRYLIVDTAFTWRNCNGLKRFTGQNRPARDESMSDGSLGTNYPNERGAAFLARENDSTVVCAFNAERCFTWGNVSFAVSNISLLGVEAHKLPRPYPLVPGGAYTSSIQVAYVVPDLEECRNVLGDSVCARATGYKCEVFYTRDGSDPRTSASAIQYRWDEVIDITETTTLKAYARDTVGTNPWWPSNVRSDTYTFQPTRATRRAPAARERQDLMRDAVLYTLSGQRLGKPATFTRGVLVVGSPNSGERPTIVARCR